ncbi:hypothetical protein Tco_0397596 [Tanacetum coccineum]
MEANTSRMVNLNGSNYHVWKGKLEIPLCEKILLGIINQLAGMGIKFEDEIQVLWLLGTLPDTWETFRTSPDGVITMELGLKKGREKLKVEAPSTEVIIRIAVSQPKEKFADVEYLCVMVNLSHEDSRDGGKGNQVIHDTSEDLKCIFNAKDKDDMTEFSCLVERSDREKLKNVFELIMRTWCDDVDAQEQPNLDEDVHPELPVPMPPFVRLGKSLESSIFHTLFCNERYVIDRKTLEELPFEARLSPIFAMKGLGDRQNNPWLRIFRDREDRVPYASAVGKLDVAMVWTRAGFSSCGLVKMSVCGSCQIAGKEALGYTGLNLAGYKENMKSTSGYLNGLCNGSIAKNIVLKRFLQELYSSNIVMRFIVTIKASRCHYTSVITEREKRVRKKDKRRSVSEVLIPKPMQADVSSIPGVCTVDRHDLQIASCLVVSSYPCYLGRILLCGWCCLSEVPVISGKRLGAVKTDISNIARTRHIDMVSWIRDALKMCAKQVERKRVRMKKKKKKISEFITQILQHFSCLSILEFAPSDRNDFGLKFLAYKGKGFGTWDLELAALEVLF